MKIRAKYIVKLNKNNSEESDQINEALYCEYNRMKEEASSQEEVEKITLNFYNYLRKVTGLTNILFLVKKVNDEKIALLEFDCVADGKVYHVEQDDDGIFIDVQEECR